MAKKKVALYIDDTSLRLLVTHGQQIKEWADSHLEPGLVKNNVIINEAEIAARLRQLFKAPGIKTKKIIVGISGLRCLSRPLTLPPLPKGMLDEAVLRGAKRLLPVPLERLYLSWQSIPAPAGKIQVFLVAVPRDTVDALFRTLRLARLRPYLLDLKPLLLTKLAPDTTAIIVDVQNSEFDAVVISDGVPQPVRTISFANEELSLTEKSSIIINDTKRTIAFFNDDNPEKALATSVPIFASGDLINEQGLRQTLSQETGHPVIPLSSPLEHPDKFVPGQYMANIALTLHKVVSGKEFGHSAINLNALPPFYRPKGISLINILALPAAAVLASLLFATIVLLQDVLTDIASIRGQLTTAEQLLQERTLQRQELDKNITQLEKQLSDTKTRIGQFTTAVGSLEKQTTGLNRDLKATMDALPKTIVLKNITRAGNLLTITGQAPDEKELLAYVEKLGASGVFADVTVTSIIRNKDNTMDFTLLGNHEGQKIAASSLEIAVNNLPPDVNLLQVSYGKGSMTITANTSAEDSILTYVKRLEESGRFRDIIVTDMTKADSGEVRVILILKTGE